MGQITSSPPESKNQEEEKVQEFKKVDQTVKKKQDSYKYSRYALASIFFLFATSISWIIAMAFTDFVEKSFDVLRSKKQQALWRGLYALITLLAGFTILYGLSLLVFNNKPWGLREPQLFEGFL